jgi:hypothetical protein
VHCVAQKVVEEEKPAEEAVDAAVAEAGKPADAAKDKDKGEEE